MTRSTIIPIETPSLGDRSYLVHDGAVAVVVGFFGVGGGFLGAFTVAAVAGSLLGSRVVGRVSPARLNLAFTVLLVAVALFMATRSILDLTA